MWVFSSIMQCYYLSCRYRLLLMFLHIRLICATIKFTYLLYFKPFFHNTPSTHNSVYQQLMQVKQSSFIFNLNRHGKLHNTGIDVDSLYHTRMTIIHVTRRIFWFFDLISFWRHIFWSPEWYAKIAFAARALTQAPQRWGAYNAPIPNCTKFVKLILRKMIKIVVTRCHILTLKCTKFDFGWGSAPDPAGGNLQSSHRPSCI